MNILRNNCNGKKRKWCGKLKNEAHNKKWCCAKIREFKIYSEATSY